MQTTSHLLMIEPVAFTYNQQTAVNNAFQENTADSRTQTKALAEFTDFVEKIRSQGINVTVVKDTLDPATPDSIFPNNWASYHRRGTMILYPMFAQNRRAERKKTVLDAISEKFVIKSTIDFTNYELEGKFLESTGSMILDRENKIAYAAISIRTDMEVFQLFCRRMHYSPVCFTAVDAQNFPIYHTNVMMCVGDKYAVLCTESIADKNEKETLLCTLKNSRKAVVDISYQQMEKFAGNMLQVHNNRGEKRLIMSTQAYESLSAEQVAVLETFNPIIHSPLYTIETNGGGSARCMISEIFLEPRPSVG